DDLRRIDARGAGGEQRALDRPGAGLDPPDVLRGDGFQRYADRVSPAQQLLEAGEVGRARGDDQFAAPAEPQAALGAVGGELPVALARGGAQSPRGRRGVVKVCFSASTLW